MSIGVGQYRLCDAVGNVHLIIQTKKLTKEYKREYIAHWRRAVTGSIICTYL